MRHVGLRYANPTYRVPTGSESAKFFDPFFVHFRLNRSRMRGGVRSASCPKGPSWAMRLGPPDVEGTVWDFYRYMARQLG